MIPVIAKIDHEYDAIQRKAGDEYPCHDEHVIVVSLLGWAVTREHYETIPGSTGRRLKTKYKQIVA